MAVNQTFLSKHQAAMAVAGPLAETQSAAKGGFFIGNEGRTETQESWHWFCVLCFRTPPYRPCKLTNFLPHAPWTKSCWSWVSYQVFDRWLTS